MAAGASREIRAESGAGLGRVRGPGKGRRGGGPRRSPFARPEKPPIRRRGAAHMANRSTGEIVAPGNARQRGSGGPGRASEALLAVLAFRRSKRAALNGSVMDLTVA